MLPFNFCNNAMFMVVSTFSLQKQLTLPAQVEGLLGLFGQRLGPHAPRAAAAVAAVASDMSLGSMASSAAGQPPDAYVRAVTLSERRTYRIPPPVALGARLFL